MVNLLDNSHFLLDNMLKLVDVPSLALLMPLLTELLLPFLLMLLTLRQMGTARKISPQLVI